MNLNFLAFREKNPNQAGSGTHFCSRSIHRFVRVEHIHRALGESFLIGSSRVWLSHLDAIPAEDRHKLARRGPSVRRDGHARLAQAMRRAIRKICLIAPVAKPISETSIRISLNAQSQRKGAVAPRSWAPEES
jgi:hypothetical protein